MADTTADISYTVILQSATTLVHCAAGWHSSVGGQSSSPSIPMDSLLSTSTTPDVTNDEFYSSWSLFIVCLLMIFALWTSYYLQIKKIRAIHETVVSIFMGMFVGLIVRLIPEKSIREMLVSSSWLRTSGLRAQNAFAIYIGLQAHPILQFAFATNHS
jgi:RsiW-degrading membrane proteinase PrsW (M82 family)